MTALSEEQQQALDARPATERPERAPRRTKDAAEPSTLAQALVAAQADMPAVEADAVNPHFRSKFVSLDHLIALTRPVLNRHGLSISQWPTHDDEHVLAPMLLTRITHVSGESMDATMPLIVGKNDMQGLGAAITYARRYAWAAALGIASETDDDGESIAQHAPSAATGASRTSQPKEAPAPVQASADDLADYRAFVLGEDRPEDLRFEWDPAYAALKREPGGVTPQAIAKHRAQLEKHLLTMAER